MDPSRKRTIRLVVALTCALLLAGALVYTSFSPPARRASPSQLAGARAGQDLPADRQGRRRAAGSTRGTVARRSGFEDRNGAARVPVRYAGSVPDPFREGREIVIDVRKQGGAFVGQPDSLVTKCPSKFTAEPKT